jgi:hypothetical protein
MNWTLVALLAGLALSGLAGMAAINWYMNRDIAKRTA